MTTLVVTFTVFSMAATVSAVPLVLVPGLANLIITMRNNWEFPRFEQQREQLRLWLQRREQEQERLREECRRQERREHLDKLPLMRYIPAPECISHDPGHTNTGQCWEDAWVKSNLPYLPLEDHRSGCLICMMDFDKPKRRDEDWGGEEPEPIRLLPCGHPYHKSCFDQWILRESTVCPYCRKKIVLTSPVKSSSFFRRYFSRS